MRYVFLIVALAFVVPGVGLAKEHPESSHGKGQVPQCRPAGSEKGDHEHGRGHEKHEQVRSCPHAASPLLTGLVSYWNLDGNSRDAVGGNDGSDVAMTYGAAYGVLGHGALFDGVSSAIGLGNPANLNITGDLSIAMWVYPLEMAEAGSVFAKTVGNGASDNTYDLAFFDDAPMQMVYANGTYFYIDSGAHLPSHTWSHVVFTRGNGNAEVRFYIDGVDAGLSNDHWAAITPLTGGDVFIGRRGNGNFFHGYVDEVGVWNRVLSPAEIAALYAGGAGKTYPF